MNFVLRWVLFLHHNSSVAPASQVSPAVFSKHWWNASNNVNSVKGNSVINQQQWQLSCERYSRVSTY